MFLWQLCPRIIISAVSASCKDSNATFQKQYVESMGEEHLMFFQDCGHCYFRWTFPPLKHLSNIFFSCSNEQTKKSFFKPFNILYYSKSQYWDIFCLSVFCPCDYFQCNSCWLSLQIKQLPTTMDQVMMTFWKRMIITHVLLLKKIIY